MLRRYNICRARLSMVKLCKTLWERKRGSIRISMKPYRTTRILSVKNFKKDFRRRILRILVFIQKNLWWQKINSPNILKTKLLRFKIVRNQEYLKFLNQYWEKELKVLNLKENTMLRPMQSLTYLRISLQLHKQLMNLLRTKNKLKRSTSIQYLQTTKKMMRILKYLQQKFSHSSA
jgi:hypothetical protein